VSKRPSLPGADALFGGQPAANTKEKQEEASATKHVKVETPKHVIRQPRRGGNPEAGRGELIKYSLYFTQPLLDKLDDVWFKLRRQKRVEKITKWKLVNVILDAALDDVQQVERLLDTQQKTDGGAQK